MILISQKNEWEYYLNNYFTEYKDIYSEFNYYLLYVNNFDVKLEAIFWEDENLQIFWPHLIRNLESIEPSCKEYYDLTTPYGYGGPLIKVLNKSFLKQSLEKFYKEYSIYALKQKYICEFIRFHPLFKNWEFLGNLLDVTYLNDVVVINLCHSLDDIRKNIVKGHKYNINKSLRNNCNTEIIEKPCKKEIEDFFEIYFLTMKRINSARKYFFSKKFIKNHFDLLNSIIIQVKKDDEIISSSIFLCGDKFLHYHLSGRIDYKGLYPTDLTIWEAIKWGKNKKFHFINLGGGIKRNDDLYKFKKGFSNNINEYYIGNIIFNLEKYNELSKMKCNESIKSTFFPAYRKNSDSII
jgi:hypothetical protein